MHKRNDDSYYFKIINEVRRISRIGKKEHLAYTLLQLIPIGCTVSYSALAELLVTTPRAIGLYMKKNKALVVIPCHRVIRKDGDLGGFSLGAKFKKKLLAVIENALSRQQKQPKCLIKNSDQFWKIVEKSGHIVDF